MKAALHVEFIQALRRMHEELKLSNFSWLSNVITPLWWLTPGTRLTKEVAKLGCFK